MKKCLRCFVTHPAVVLPLLVALVGFFALQLPKLRIDFSPEFQRSPQQEVYTQVQADFGVKLSTVVLFPVDGDIFTTESFVLLQQLSAAIGKLDGVDRVQSLATVKAIRGGKGFVRVEKLYSAAALRDDMLPDLKQDVLNSSFWQNSLIAKHGASAMIQVYIAEDIKDPVALIAKIEEILTAHSQDGYGLSQAVEAQFQTDWSMSGMWRILLCIPLTVLLTGIILFLAYRNWSAMLLPLLSISASLLTTLGCMTYMGYTLNPATLLVLPLILALACAGSGRVFTTYVHKAAECDGRTSLFAAIVRHDGIPLLVTALTFAPGLLLFVFSTSSQLKEFGICAAAGVALNWIFCLLLLPGLGQYFPCSSASAQHIQFALLTIQGWMIRIYEGSRILTVVVLAVLFLFAASGISSLRIEPVEWRSGTVTNQTGLSLKLVLEGGRENRVKEPEVLRQLDALQQFFARQAWCDGTRSFVDYLKLVHREMLGGLAESAQIPPSRELVSQYLLLLGSVDLKDVVNADYSAATLLVTHRLGNAHEVSMAIDSIRDYAQTSLSRDVSLDITGYDILRQDALERRVTEQLFFLFFLLGGVFLILSLLFLSFKVGVVALLPALLTLTLHFGFMGRLVIPLYDGSVLLALFPLCLSLGNIIHFLTRYREGFMETNDQNQAIGTTIYHEGEAVLFSSIALLLGFALSAFTGPPAAAHLGALGVLGVLSALLNVFLFHPLLLDMIPIITVWHFVRFDLDRQLLRNNRLFAGLRTSQIKKLLLLGGIRRFTNAEAVIRQGEQGDAMFLLLDGEAEVYAEENGQRRELATVAPGGVFGEMALLGEPVRSANVRALRETKCLQIDERSLARVKRAYPRIAAQLYLNLSSLLSDRLKGQVSILLDEERNRCELTTAHSIQQDLLPKATLAHALVHVEAMNEPARGVGGDFYDYFHVGRDKYVFIIGDVCGKGVPAAIFMARAMSIIRTQAQIDPDPLQVISTANRLIAEDSRSQELYVTLFYGLFDAENRALRYINAGMPAPLLYRASSSSCSSLAVTNHAAGMFDFANFDLAELSLQQGDTLLLYSDGINEAKNAKGEQFGGENVARVLLNTGRTSPEILRKAIIEQVAAFAEEQRQHDDITLMIVQV